MSASLVEEALGIGALLVLFTDFMLAQSLTSDAMVLQQKWDQTETRQPYNEFAGQSVGLDWCAPLELVVHGRC